MNKLSFQALGTEWEIKIDEPKKILDLSRKIKKIVTTFEKNFSRFDSKSLLSQYNAGKTVKVTDEFSKLLKFSKELETISGGYFISDAGKYLGKLGYGTGKQGLDFGAFGKGWLTDTIATFLKGCSINYFLINAGGDIFASQKKSGEGWIVALELPKENNKIFGTIVLKNSALAASSPFKRAWGKHNHLVNGKTNQPINSEKSVFVQAKEAKIADAFATILNIIPDEEIPQLVEKNQFEFLILENQKIKKSTGFTCKLFNV